MATHGKGASVTKTVSIPEGMYAEVEERLASLGITSLSRYVQDLIREDLKARGSLTVSEKSQREARSRLIPNHSSYPSHTSQASLAEDAPLKMTKPKKAA